MTEDKVHIFLKYTVLGMILMIYTLGCWVGYVTMKTTYDYVLYYFVDSSTRPKQKYQSFKVTIALHMISYFMFQAICKRKKSEFVLLKQYYWMDTLLLGVTSLIFVTMEGEDSL